MSRNLEREYNDALHQFTDAQIKRKTEQEKNTKPIQDGSWILDYLIDTQLSNIEYRVTQMAKKTLKNGSDEDKEDLTSVLALSRKMVTLLEELTPDEKNKLYKFSANDATSTSTLNNKATEDGKLPQFIDASRKLQTLGDKFINKPTPGGEGLGNALKWFVGSIMQLIGLALILVPIVGGGLLDAGTALKTTKTEDVGHAAQGFLNYKGALSSLKDEEKTDDSHKNDAKNTEDGHSTKLS